MCFLRLESIITPVSLSFFRRIQTAHGHALYQIPYISPLAVGWTCGHILYVKKKHTARYIALALHGENPASLASRVPDGAQFHLVRLGPGWLGGALVVGVLLEELARLGRVALLRRVLL